MTQQHANDSLLSWIGHGVALTLPWAILYWFWTLGYNLRPLEVSDRLLMLAGYSVLLVACGIVIQLAGFIVAWAGLRRTRVGRWLKVAPLAALLVGSLLVGRLLPHGIYYEGWGIESRWLALALRSLQALVCLGVSVGAGIAVAVLLERGGRRARSLLFVSGFILAAGAIALGLLWPILASVEGRSEMPTRCSSAPPTVLLLGFDGMTWSILDPLIEQGELPNLARMREQGSWARLRTVVPTSSPEIWTTIATGDDFGTHGVLGHTSFRFLGMSQELCFPHGSGMNFLGGSLAERFGLIVRRPVPSTMRRTAAIWDITSLYGLQTAVVGWLGSFPAESIAGTVVTDTFHSALKGALATGRPMDPHALKGAISPARMLPEVLSAIPDPQNKSEVYFDIVRYLLAREPQPRLLMAWFGLADAAQHKYWKYYEPDKFFDVSAEGIEQFGGVIPKVYRMLDAFLGDVIAELPKGSVVIVCSDHGAGPVLGELRHSGGHTDAPDGILLITGPSIKRGYRINDPSVFDLMPTLCQILGLPISTSWRGRVLEDAFEDGAMDACPVRKVDGFPAPMHRYEGGAALELDETVNEEMKSHLRELGYIQ